MASEEDFPVDAGAQQVRTAEDYLKALGQSPNTFSTAGGENVSAPTPPAPELVSPPEEYGGEESQQRVRELLETQGMDGIRRFLLERGFDPQFIDQRIREEKNEFGRPTDKMTVEAYLHLRASDLSEQADSLTRSVLAGPETMAREIGLGVTQDLYTEAGSVKVLAEIWKDGRAIEPVQTYIERGKPEALVQAAVQMDVLRETSVDHPASKGAAGSLIGVGARYIGAHRLAQQVQARMASGPPKPFFRR